MGSDGTIMKGLRFVARKSNLRRILIIVIILTVLVITYVLLQQRLQVRITFNKEQQNQSRGGLQNSSSPTQREDILHRTYLISRTRCTQQVFLLIMVLTAPANFDRRAVIRKTWATDASMKVRWRTVFLLGQVVSDSIQNKYLKAEGEVYRDLIQGVQNDNYYNLTLKTQMGLEWAAKYCDFQFLLKADDDVFVNPYNLMDYLRKPNTPETNLFMGRCFYDASPRRSGKYRVSYEEYNKTRYPNYCNGPAYLLSADLVYKLVELFDVKNPLKMEDVYIGMLVESIGGVEAIRHPGFRTQQFGPCNHQSNTFAYHRASTDCLEELFKEATKERLEYELTTFRSTRIDGQNETKQV